MIWCTVLILIVHFGNSKVRLRIKIQPIRVASHWSQKLQAQQNKAQKSKRQVPCCQVTCLWWIVTLSVSIHILGELLFPLQNNFWNWWPVSYRVSSISFHNWPSENELKNFVSSILEKLYPSFVFFWNSIEFWTLYILWQIYLWSVHDLPLRLFINQKNPVIL